LKIKKFDAQTEQEAIEKVKTELGLDALVLSIKTTKPKGMFAFMRNPHVEVMAAYDEKKFVPKPSVLPSVPPAALPKAQPEPAALAMPQPAATGEQDTAAQSRADEVERIVESIQAIQSLQGGFPANARSRPTPEPVALRATQPRLKALNALAQPTIQGILADPTMTENEHSYREISANAAIMSDTAGAGGAASTAPNLPPGDSKDTRISRQAERIRSLEKKLDNTEDMLANTMQRLSVAEHLHGRGAERKYDNNLLQIFYDTLCEQGVRSEIAEDLLSDVATYELHDLDVIVKVVYSKIVQMLGTAELVDVAAAKRGKPVTIAFIGPTGVGKTTTIAKLSSLFILGLNKSVGLITADTYRIAAVEQLKTYGEILGAPVMTAYNKADVANAVKKLSKTSEIVIMDTAGRSHKHKENVEELQDLLEAAPKAVKYLVLSTTTKCEDILSIIDMYAGFTDFNLIFTKLDETNCLGAILNACCISGKKVSYVTTGQNVPDDIEVMQPERIARALLGFGTI